MFHIIDTAHVLFTHDICLFTLICIYLLKYVLFFIFKKVYRINHIFGTNLTFWLRTIFNLFPDKPLLQIRPFVILESMRFLSQQAVTWNQNITNISLAKQQWMTNVESGSWSQQECMLTYKHSVLWVDYVHQVKCIFRFNKIHSLVTFTLPEKEENHVSMVMCSST